MERRFVVLVLSTAALIATVLLCDQPGLPAQLALGSVTAIFLLLLARNSSIDTRQIIAAILIATTGEVILSLGWRLYTYRNALIPLYVPFGHGVMYALAAMSARQPLLQRHAKAIVRFVLISGNAIAIASFVVYRDQWGLLWWIAAATLLVRSANALLLSSCFIYTIALEWIGTAIGNWRWADIVPGLGLRSANPPSGVGILYILLDLITVAVCTSLALASAVPLPSAPQQQSSASS